LANYRGGAIYNAGCTDVTIDGCTFDGDEAERGGAIADSTTFASIESSTFTGDTATAGGEFGGLYAGGGAIYNSFYSSPSISNCTFTDNRAYNGGAIADYDYSTPAIDQCTFSGNYARAYGGAIDNVKCYGYLTISHCTFEGDEAQFGGGPDNIANDHQL
jgi:hypothetical protein